MLTPQAIYYRFRNEKLNHQTPGEPNVAEAALVPEAALTPEVATDPLDDPVLAPDN